MPKPTYTVSQVIATPENDWVNAEVFAVLSNPKAPNGKGPWSATLTDSTGSIVGKFWGGSIDHWNGKRIKVSGQGLQRKAYKGVPELSVSQKADISFAGAPGTAGQAVDHNADLESASPRSSQQSAPNAAKSPAMPIHGATVGGALARAVEIWKHIRPAGSGQMPDRQDFEDIDHLTRTLCDIQRRIEAGEDQVPF